MINDQIFYHINRDCASSFLWKPGYKITCKEDQLTFYHKDLLQASNLDPIRLKENELKEYRDYSKKLKQLTLQLIFENVRLKFFPELPSRLNSIWLSKDIAQAKLWDELIGGFRKKIFKVKCTGTVHCADGAFFDLNKPLEEFEDQAHKYWKGEIFHIEKFREPEILFFGELEVLEMISPKSIGNI